MRFVNRSYQAEDTPAHLWDTLGIAGFKEVLAGNTSKIKDEIYRGDKSTQKTRDVLARCYLNKCAYCEDIEYKPEVEHYRPTGKSTQDGGHTGYRWLCYEWSNMLPSCHACNHTGAKGTRFPIMGNRISEYPRTADGSLNIEACRLNHPLMLAEQPMLLHPEIDDPKQFFKFDSEGKIFGTDAQGRGDKTIEICCLLRENLCSGRKRIVDDILKRVRNHLILFEQGKLDENGLSAALEQIFSELQENTNNPQESFTLFRWYFFEYFPVLFSEAFAHPEDPAMVAYLKFILSRYNHFRAAYD